MKPLNSIRSRPNNIAEPCFELFAVAQYTVAERFRVVLACRVARHRIDIIGVGLLIGKETFIRAINTN